MNISAVVLTRGDKDLTKLKRSLSFCNEILIIKNPQITDFAKVRNEVLARARHDWVLFLDDDEALSKELKHEIRSTKFEKQNCSGYFIKRKIIFSGRVVGRDKVLRLAKRSGGSWQRGVHEIWAVRGKTKTCKNYLIHQTADNLHDYLDKINYFSGLHARENLKEGKKAALFKIVFYPPVKLIYNLLLGRDFVFSLMQAFHSFLSWSKLYFLPI